MNLAFLYIAMNVNVITNTSPELLRKGARGNEDVISENKSFDPEKISVASSESNSVCVTSSSSRTVIVKNSTDVQIGDRTYLTIQNAIPDSEIVEKIINEVIVSSKCKKILNKEKDQLGSTLDLSLDNLENLTKDCPSFISTQNGGKEIPKDSSNKLLEKRWLSGDFALCGHLINIKIILMLIILLLVLVTGCILAILKRIADVESPSSSIGGQPSTPILLPTASITQPDGTSNSSEASVHRPKNWYLITRKDWNAYEAVATDVFYLQHPVKNVIIAHTAGTTCLTEVRCLEMMRNIQAWAVGNNNFDDIPYNFLVGGDGNAFEGLGWDIRGAHSSGYNSISIAIAFIGNFVYVRPTPQQFEALKRLLAWGVDIGKLDPDYRLLPHNLTHATLSPGRFVYEEIKTWPHFTEERFYTH